MLEDLVRPVIFAHRGASAFAPENTLAAFRLAVELGVPAIELDVKLTADRQVVVLHDPTLDRTTDGKGLLRQHTLAQVKALDAGSFFAPGFRGERIPTLEEVFEEVGQRVFINVELTNYTTPADDLVRRVAELVRKCGMQERVLFSSFNWLNLVVASRLVPGIPLGYLADVGRSGALARSFMGQMIPHQALHPYFSDVDEKLMRRVHGQKRRVHVWTVNPPVEIRRLFGLGVDGIFTDDPRQALQIRENYHRNEHTW